MKSKEMYFFVPLKNQSKKKFGKEGLERRNVDWAEVHNIHLTVETASEIITRFH